MATIEARKNISGTTSYRVLVRLKDFPTETATFARKTDAKKWAAHTEAAMREDRYFTTVEAKRHRLHELINKYIRNVLPTKPKSEEKQKMQLKWWESQLGAYTLNDITPTKIYECRDTLLSEITYRKTKRSPATVNRYLAALSHAFTVAVKEWGWIETNPLFKVSKLKEPRGKVRFLSDSERERLLKVCQESDNRCLYIIVMLCLSTGARKNEIMTLNWDNVDFNRNVITLRETKNGEIRLLPLVHKARELLLAHSKVRNLESNLLFPDNHNINKPTEIRWVWEVALKQAEITNFRFHDLRHSAASYLAMDGASLSEISEVLGHKTLEMVKRYAHLSEAHTAKVVTSMNERIFR